MTENVLIVDDSATMRKAIMRGIRQAGIDNAACREAGDGLAGPTVCEGTTFDLILCDVNMLNRNGIDFVTEVTTKLNSPSPSVMITTEESEEVIRAAMSRDANGHLKQPFTAEKIQEILGPLLP